MKNFSDKYYNDVYFRRLVDVMLNEIRQLNTTPTEIREAAMFAQYLFELENPGPIYFKPPFGNDNES